MAGVEIETVVALVIAGMGDLDVRLLRFEDLPHRDHRSPEHGRPASSLGTPRGTCRERQGLIWAEHFGPVAHHSSLGHRAAKRARADTQSVAFYHRGVQPRQIIAVLVTFIAILGAATFVLNWTGDDDDNAGDGAATDVTSSTTSSTSTSSTSTTTSTTTTTIPVDCSVDAPATTTTEAADPADGDADLPDEDTEIIVPTLGPASSISTVGLDTVHFGMTVKQAESAAGTQMIPCAPVSSCYRVTPTVAPEGISFVVHQGTIERVDIASGPITTRSGVGIGTAEDRIIELFGDQIERAVNDDSSVDLIFVPQDEDDADFRVIFTIRDGVVETFRSGRVPLVLGEACAEA